jgi:hypothetical protein
VDESRKLPAMQWMAKQGQWRRLAAGLSPFVALYAAGLSTFLAVQEYRRDVRDRPFVVALIDGTVRQGFSRCAEGFEWQTGFQVSNVGRRPISVTRVTAIEVEGLPASFVSEVSITSPLRDAPVMLNEAATVPLVAHGLLKWNGRKDVLIDRDVRLVVVLETNAGQQRLPASPDWASRLKFEMGTSTAAELFGRDMSALPPCTQK